MSRVVKDSLSAHLACDEASAGPAPGRTVGLPMVGQTVAHYRILAHLGGGGMGVVYEAEDTRLGRRVALKFISDRSVAAGIALERFRREAHSASALNHPHICTVHDIGEHDTRPFIVMEKLEGETLRCMLASKPVPYERLLLLGSEIADALAAAHAAGIVHRDVKPANIFVTRHGEAKLLDFGLARIETSPSSSSGEVDLSPGSDLQDITDPGKALGTIAYMSPEQSCGETIDARSDIFSLGAVLYEMATGSAPFRGATPGLTIDAILNRPPPPPSQVNRAIPEALDKLILGALEKDRHLRIQSAAELRMQLLQLRGDHPLRMVSTPSRVRSPWRMRSAAAASILLILILSIVAWQIADRATSGNAVETSAVAPQEARLAVLPFENLGTEEQAYFADGMTDEVRGKLAGLRGLPVIGRASSNGYRGTKKTSADIARELGVNHLLTATVRWQKSDRGSRIRVSPELVEIGEEGVAVLRWQQTFDADLADVFAVQTQIAVRVAEALQLAIGRAETLQLSEKPTSSLAAYDAYIRASRLRAGGWGPVVTRQAITLLEEAVALDPQFADAWGELAHARAVLYDYAPSAEGAEAVRVAAETAYALGPLEPGGYMALGMYQHRVLADSVLAASTYRRGLERFSDHCGLLLPLGQLERDVGNYDVALGLFRRAVALDPRSWGPRQMLGAALIFLRRPAEARRELEVGLALNPAQDYLRSLKRVTHLQEGDLAAARASFAEISESRWPRAIGALLWMYPANSWTLDDSQRELLLRLGPGVFNDNRGRWGDALATEQWLRGNRAEARRWAEEARKGYEAQLVDTPDDPLIHGGLARVLSVLGMKREAEREASRALELAVSPRPRGVRLGWILEAVAVTYVRTGEHEKAIDTLERLLTVPHIITPSWLRIDPNFEPLRGNPRFERLLE